MRVDFDPKAREELENLKKEHRAFVLTRIEELQENPTSHENSGLIRVGGRQVFKYVMKEGSKGVKDYSLIFCLSSGRSFSNVSQTWSISTPK
jgi:mRNA-degrading endonuclease RelE of RelBE toxin-antitoxin system